MNRPLSNRMLPRLTRGQRRRRLLFRLLQGAAHRGPAFLGDLVATRHGQRIGRHVFGDAGACANIRAIFNADRCHQRGITATKTLLPMRVLCLLTPS